MPKIKYDEEFNFRGIVFKKWQIFYADRVQSEWSWWGYYWRRWVIVIFFLLNGILPWLVLLWILFWSVKPRNRRIFVNNEYLWWKWQNRILFVANLEKNLTKKKNIFEIKIFKMNWRVCIYKKWRRLKKFRFGEINNVGRVDKLIALLKKYNYPLTVVEDVN